MSGSSSFFRENVNLSPRPTRSLGGLGRKAGQGRQGPRSGGGAALSRSWRGGPSDSSAPEHVHQPQTALDLVDGPDAAQLRQMVPIAI